MHLSVEYQLCGDDTQAPTMVSYRLSLLRKLRLNYESQTQIDPHQVCMANAVMAKSGLDPGRFVQWMGGKYTCQH
jgi:hypothetical protein